MLVASNFLFHSVNNLLPGLVAFPRARAVGVALLSVGDIYTTTTGKTTSPRCQDFMDLAVKAGNPASFESNGCQSLRAAPSAPTTPLTSPRRSIRYGKVYPYTANGELLAYLQTNPDLNGDLEVTPWGWATGRKRALWLIV